MLRVSRREILFCVGWFFFSISVIFGLTEFVEVHKEWQFFLKLIRYIGYALCSVKIWDELIEKKSLYWFILLFAVLIWQAILVVQ